MPISTRRFRWYIPALVREPSQAIMIQTRLDNDPGSDSVRKKPNHESPAPWLMVDNQNRTIALDTGDMA
nr:hypothetical protein GCM10017611_82310 [Rhodococcus wratislaviensis]